MSKQLFIMFVVMMRMMSGSYANGDDTLSSSSSLTAREIPTDTEKTSYYSNDVSRESPEKMVNGKIDSVNGNIENNGIKTTTPSIVLQPNIAGALDVGQGLLVPLVPVVDPNSKNNNQPQAISPLVANLLPVTVETVTPDVNSPEKYDTKAEMRPINDDMEIAEDIIFRPLFRYRQEAAARRKSYNQNRYYQPYIYAYKPSRQNNYNENDRRSLRYYSRDDDDDD